MKFKIFLFTFLSLTFLTLFASCRGNDTLPTIEDIRLYKSSIEKIEKRWDSAYNKLQSKANPKDKNIYNQAAIENYILPKFFAIKSTLENLYIDSPDLIEANQLYINYCEYQIHFFENIRDYLISNKQDTEKLESADIYLKNANKTYQKYKKALKDITKKLEH